MNIEETKLHLKAEQLIYNGTGYFICSMAYENGLFYCIKLNIKSGEFTIE